MHVALDVLVDEIEALRCQRRPGRSHRADAVEAMRADWCQSRLVHRVDEFRRRPEQRHPVSSAKSNSTLPSGWKGDPSYSNSVASEASAGDQPVPHHPAAGREIEDTIAWLDVAVKLMFFQVLDSVPPAPCTMHLGTPVVPEE